MHMRCCAHILNLVVVDGLKEEADSIHRIRAAIKHIKSSSARETKFKSCIEIVSLDVSTRCNSTYLMLERALKFQKAFDRLAEDDEHYSHALELDKGLPTSDDWESVRHLCKFLKIFYNATLRFSGSIYVTCNAFFHQFCEILETLKGWSISSDTMLKEMTLKMQVKIDKYWDDDRLLNYYMFVAVVLDPRYKLGCVEYCFDRIYLSDKANAKIAKIKDTLNRLYAAYSLFHPSVGDQMDSDSRFLPEPEQISLSSQYKRKLKEKESIEKKSELERYLIDNVEEDYESFDILDWWKRRT